jgi:hypothetical protein
MIIKLSKEMIHAYTLLAAVHHNDVQWDERDTIQDGCSER